MAQKFNSGIAERFGITAALLLEHIWKEVKENEFHNRYSYEGNTWMRCSKKAFTVHMPYLSKAENDEKTAKDLDEMLSGVESAYNWLKNAFARDGLELVSCGYYIDENGKMGSYSVVEKKHGMFDGLTEQSEKSANRIKEKQEKAREQKKADERKTEKKEAEEKREQQVKPSKDNQINELNQSIINHRDGESHAAKFIELYTKAAKEILDASSDTKKDSDYADWKEAVEKTELPTTFQNVRYNNFQSFFESLRNQSSLSDSWISENIGRFMKWLAV